LDRFRTSFHTQTYDKSEYAFGYVRGLLRIETKRNMANIARKTGMVEQNTQHFMSYSPWSGPGLITDIQKDVKQHAEFQTGAMLVIDESAEQKAGEYSAGAGRQHNGRLGKIEMSQVGVFAALVTPRVNTWIDGELFLPEHWFAPDYLEQRKKVGFPKGRTFKTKPELAWDMLQRIQANGIPFEAVAMDDLYGRNAQLRRRLEDAQLEYYGDIPENTVIYLDKPRSPTHSQSVASPVKTTRWLPNSATKCVNCANIPILSGRFSPCAPMREVSFVLGLAAAEYGPSTRENADRDGC